MTLNVVINGIAMTIIMIINHLINLSLLPAVGRIRVKFLELLVEDSKSHVEIVSLDIFVWLKVIFCGFFFNYLVILVSDGSGMYSKPGFRVSEVLMLRNGF